MSWIVARAVRAGRGRNLVEQYIAEGLNLDAHPGIALVDGPTGRRAVLASRRGRDAWEVISTLEANTDSVRETAEILALPESEVRLATGYCGANQDEIDDRIAANEAAAAEAEGAWRRERKTLR